MLLLPLVLRERFNARALHISIDFTERGNFAKKKEVSILFYFGRQKRT